LFFLSWIEDAFLHSFLGFHHYLLVFQFIGHLIQNRPQLVVEMIFENTMPRIPSSAVSVEFHPTCGGDIEEGDFLWEQ